MPAAYKDSSHSTSPSAAARAVRFGSDEAARLLEGKEALLANPAAHGWEKVKHNASRTVFRGSIDGRQVYLKQFHALSLWKRIALAVGICDARRELEMSTHLRGRGVKACRVLAAAWGGHGQWVLTEAVTTGEGGDVWHSRCLEDEGSAGRIRAASRGLARLIAGMHSAGVLHGDLHCGNVMVCEQSDGGSEAGMKMVLMDLHRASRRRERGRGRILSRGARAANLAQLCCDRMAFTTRSQRLRFLKQYLHFSGASGSLGGWETMVSFFAERHARRHRAHRDRRIGGNNRYLARISPGRQWRGHAILATKTKMADSPASHATFSKEDWCKALASPAALLEGDDVLVVKDSASGRVVRRSLTVGDSTLDVFVKLAHRRGRLKTLTDCFRPSRALRGFRLGHMLLTRRFATPLPLAAVKHRRGPLLLESILITEASPATWICTFLDESLADPSRVRDAHRVLWGAGRMLRRLHDLGWAHRDLKATNLLTPPHFRAQTCPIMVDLDGLSRPVFMTARRRLANLARLEVALGQLPRVTRTGRLRTLLGYLLRPGATRDGFKTYWRVMADAAARKMRRPGADDHGRRQP